MLDSVKEIVEAANNAGKPISELITEEEIKTSGLSRGEIWKKMCLNLQTMQNAVKRGESGKGVPPPTGLTGGEAVKVAKYWQTHRILSGDTVMGAVQAVMVTNEVNAALGITCTTPTAGSSGTLPGVTASLEKRLNLGEDALVRFLFTTVSFGWVITNHTGIAGAAGGYQAEVGNAPVMGAAAAVEAAGGTPQQCAEALPIAINNLLGLACNPIAGLVEVPCVKRNAIGAANTLASADLALAGCASVTPVDECIVALDKVGKSISAVLRETGVGGLVGAPTGQVTKAKIFGKDA